MDIKEIESIKKKLKTKFENAQKREIEELNSLAMPPPQDKNKTSISSETKPITLKDAKDIESIKKRVGNQVQERTS